MGSKGVTIRELYNRFCTAEERQRDAGGITSRTFAGHYTTWDVALREFGKDRFASDLAVDDFEALRATLAKRCGILNTLSNEVQRTRTLVKYGYDN